jgi:Stem cell factor
MTRARNENQNPSDPDVLHSHSGHDPLQAAKDQSNAFNRAWLKNGESQPPIQKVGFAVFSLIFLVIGFFFGMVCWGSFRSEDPTTVLWLAGALFFVGLGGLGLRKAIRSKRSGR